MKTATMPEFKDIEKAFRTMQTKEDGMIKPLISFS